MTELFRAKKHGHTYKRGTLSIPVPFSQKGLPKQLEKTAVFFAKSLDSLAWLVGLKIWSPRG